MRAETTSGAAERDRSGWLPAVHAVLAAVVIGAVGALGTLQVWVLALAGALVARSIARRDGSEPAADDPTAELLKLAFVVVLCGAAFDNRVQRPGVLAPSATSLGGLALIAAGLVLRWRAMRALGPHFTVKVLVREGHRLVDGGPYRTIRHPNYAGLVLVMVGTVAMLRSPLALAALLFLWLPAVLLRIRAEEAALGRQLGDRYHGYARRTWRLVPGLF